MFTSAKGKQQKEVRQLQCQEQCILDSRYSFIASIRSLTYSSTLSFIYGIEIHGRGLAEGPALVL